MLRRNNIVFSVCNNIFQGRIIQRKWLKLRVCDETALALMRGGSCAHTGLAHISPGTWDLTTLSHTLLLSIVGILIISVSEGLWEDETGEMLGS